MDFVRAALLVLAAAAAIAALASLGGMVSEWLDVLTHFTPLYLAGGLTALVLAIAAGSPNRATLIAAMIALAVSGAMMLPEFLARFGQSEGTTPGHALKLIQFNLWDRNIDPAGTARWIEAENPDIVIVEEAVGGGGAVAASLGAVFPYRSRCARGGDCSTVILSRRPLGATGDLRDVDTEKFSGAWADVEDGSSTFTVVGVHLTWPAPPGHQQAQSLKLSRRLDAFDRKSLILAGDFNSTPWSFALRRQDTRFAIPRLTRALLTWPAAARTHWGVSLPLPLLPIDHVYAGPAWRLISIRRGPRLGSDHFPVVVEIARASTRGS